MSDLTFLLTNVHCRKTIRTRVANLDFAQCSNWIGLMPATDPSNAMSDCRDKQFKALNCSSYDDS